MQGWELVGLVMYAVVSTVCGMWGIDYMSNCYRANDKGDSDEGMDGN